MTRAYKRIMEEGTTAYGNIARYMVENPEKPFILHCTAGKDRTGVICALILSFCGVEDEIIASEYNMTEQGLGDWMDTLVKAVLKYNKGDETRARKMAGARKESMLGALKMITSDYGGAEGYFKDKLGLSSDDIAALKKTLVVDEKPVLGVS